MEQRRGCVLIVGWGGGQYAHRASRNIYTTAQAQRLAGAWLAQELVVSARDGGS